MNKSRFLAVVCLLLFTTLNTAHAVTIQVDVVDSNNINLTFSGIINGPEPDWSLGVIFLDTPVPNTVTSNSVNITGDAMLGSLPVNVAYSGYDNIGYAGSLQLRNSPNGDVPLAVGDVLSGTAAILFSSPHGMTQSMFDGIGVPIYWGASDPSFETLQGYAVSVVPVPAAVWLFGSGLLGLIGVARRKKA